MITKQEAELIQTIAIAVAVDHDEQTVDYVRNDRRPNLLNELRDKFGIKRSSGMYRTAFILDNVVVKMSQDSSRQKELVDEAKFINKMRKHKQYGRHFPQTEIFKVGRVTLQIQEKVDMNHRAGNRWAMEDDVMDLAESLGIEDMHDGNFGWKGPKGKEYPVFVDVDFRFKPSDAPRRRKRSWMV